MNWTRGRVNGLPATTKYTASALSGKIGKLLLDELLPDDDIEDDDDDELILKAAAASLAVRALLLMMLLPSFNITSSTLLSCLLLSPRPSFPFNSCKFAGGMHIDFTSNVTAIDINNIVFGY